MSIGILYMALVSLRNKIKNYVIHKIIKIIYT